MLKPLSLRTLVRPTISSSSPLLTRCNHSLPARKAKDHTASNWKGQNTDGGESAGLIDGEWVRIGESAGEWYDVRDPSTQTLLTRVPSTPPTHLERAIDAAETAFKSWSKTSLLSRQAMLMEFARGIRANWDELGRSIVLEQGKTFADAKGDVLRGLQVVEAMTAIPNLLMAPKLEVSEGMDTYVRRSPLGVGVAICPFNFPAMIPLWNIPVALATGNTLILKPSERDPGASLMLAELAIRAGFPKGVLQVVHGGKDVVKYLCEEERVKAITFVGGGAAGKAIWDMGTAKGKRVQANLGAKNHAILMPDANKEHALNAIAGAAFGAAGQRCMALSVVVTVGGAKEWIPDLIKRAKALKVGNGFEEGVDLGPVISPAAKQKIESLIASCPEEGGKILLDGRGAKVEGYPDGNWVGATILEAKEGMKCHETEIFGPVLTILNVDTLEEAIALVNRNQFGNGASIFTKDGATARLFERTIEAGQIGVNTPIPVPLPMFSWSGNKASVLGGHSLYGQYGVDFWTQNQTITSLWRSEDALTSKAEVAMPTMR